jgi:uncharacterized protein YqeY
MLDISKLMIKAMKKELYKDSDELNNAARQVLGEMKTKIKDIREDITNNVQYKLLQKMKKDRENSVKIYTEAFEKSNSNVAKNNLEKAKNELEPIDLFLNELEAEMPKKLSEDEVRSLVKDTIEKFGDNPNKGMIMKLFKARIDVDMAMVAKIVNELLK